MFLRVLSSKNPVVSLSRLLTTKISERLKINIFYSVRLMTLPGNIKPFPRKIFTMGSYIQLYVCLCLAYLMTLKLYSAGTVVKVTNLLQAAESFLRS
jgi:hypothetical protein